MLMIESYDDIRVEKKLDGYQLVINIGSDDCFYKTPESKDGALMDILKGVKRNPAEVEEANHRLHDMIDIYEIAFDALKCDRECSDERLALSARSAMNYVEYQLKKNGKG